jgi:FKBP-type peptidyl-prolyl cis-trans isomerase 2
MAIKKNDFVELEFTGKTEEGNTFDTNIKEEAVRIGIEIDSRPLVICIGQNMILPAIDEFLEGREPGRFTLRLEPEKAFGARNREMIKTMPIKIFHTKNISPRAGLVFQFDALLGRISAVSGGRVIVDFNNPLAGKAVIYELNAKKILESAEEKVKVLMQNFFSRVLDFKIEASKLIVSVEPNFSQLVEYFKPKFKEILNLDMEVQKLEKKEEDKKDAENKPEEKATEKQE